MTTPRMACASCPLRCRATLARRSIHHAIVRQPTRPRQPIRGMARMVILLLVLLVRMAVVERVMVVKATASRHRRSLARDRTGRRDLGSSTAMPRSPPPASHRAPTPPRRHLRRRRCGRPRSARRRWPPCGRPPSTRRRPPRLSTGGGLPLRHPSRCLRWTLSRGLRATLST